MIKVELKEIGNIEAIKAEVNGSVYMLAVELNEIIKELATVNLDK